MDPNLDMPNIDQIVFLGTTNNGLSYVYKNWLGITCYYLVNFLVIQLVLVWPNQHTQWSMRQKFLPLEN